MLGSLPVTAPYDMTLRLWITQKSRLTRLIHSYIYLTKVTISCSNWYVTCYLDVLILDKVWDYYHPPPPPFFRKRICRSQKRRALNFFFLHHMSYQWVISGSSIIQINSNKHCFLWQLYILLYFFQFLLFERAKWDPQNMINF